MAERLYYTDSFLKTFEANVTDIREHSRRDGASVWHVALDRTAFYPTSGGQPHDTGSFIATAPSGATLTVPVESVEEDESGEVWHATTKPLLAGTRIRGSIDWLRRLDHMQQHSGQHLLSATLLRELGAPTVSFHLGAESSTIDLAAGTLEPAKLSWIEQLVNLAVAENVPVRLQVVDGTEAKAMMAEGKLRKLPEREGTIRLVEISGIDLNACGGTHVSALGQVGVLLLRGTERVKQGVRLSFVCGLRAARIAHQDDAVLSELSRTLSTRRELLHAAVERKMAESKSAGKERQSLREELADYHAARLLVEDPIERGRRLVVRKFPNRDVAYTKLLSSRLTAAAPQTISLLTSQEQEPATVILSRSEDLAGLHCGDLLRQALVENDLRGGGSAQMAQGQVPRPMLDPVIDALQERLEAQMRKLAAASSSVTV